MAKWTGWWTQRGFGRQTMHNLVLEVEGDGTVIGSGEDCIGLFAFQGQFLPDGSVSLVKQYLGRHKVWYQGCNSGEGIFGKWRIPGFNAGRFALRPMHDGAAQRGEIRALVPTRQEPR